MLCRSPGSPNNSPVTRFTSECDLCSELLEEYLSAANEIVDARQPLHSRKPASARQLASALIDNSLKRRANARKRFFHHKEKQH